MRAAEVFLIALAVALPLGPRFASGVGKITTSVHASSGKDVRMPILRKGLVLFALCLALIPASEAAAVAAQIHGLRWTITPYAGVAFWGENVSLKTGVLLGGRTALMFGSHIGIGGIFGFSPGETDSAPWPFVPTVTPTRPAKHSQPVDDDVRHLGLDLILDLGAYPLSPYVFGGWQHIRFTNDDPEWGTTTFHGHEFGGGINWVLRSRLALTVEGRNIIFEFDDPPYEAPHGKNHSLFVTAGLRFALGGSVRFSEADSDGLSDRKHRRTATLTRAPIERLPDRFGPRSRSERP